MTAVWWELAGSTGITSSSVSFYTPSHPRELTGDLSFLLGKNAGFAFHDIGAVEAKHGFVTCGQLHRAILPSPGLTGFLPVRTWVETITSLAIQNSEFFLGTISSVLQCTCTMNDYSPFCEFFFSLSHLVCAQIAATLRIISRHCRTCSRSHFLQCCLHRSVSI